MTADTSAIWRAFGNRLKAYIRKHVGQESDAEDVLQDVFLRIQAGIGRVRDTAKLEAWIFQVTRFAIADHLRGRRRPSEAPVEEVPAEPGNGTLSSLVASWLSPLMEELPAGDRDALRHSMRGSTQKALAEKLGLSPSSARSRVQRARRRLKDILLKCCEVELDRRGNAISYTRRGAECPRCACD